MNIRWKKLQIQISARVVQIALIILALVIVLLFELIEVVWPDLLTPRGWALFHMVAAGLVAYAVTTWGVYMVGRRDELEQRLVHLENRLDRSDRQQEVVFHFGRRLVEAEDESEITDEMLRLGLEVSGALGASFVPFDERGQPMAAISRGSLPSSLLESWAEHLAQHKVREECSQCDVLQAGQDQNCPLLINSPFEQTHPEIQHVHCQILRCGSRAVGMFTLYLQEPPPLDSELSGFLRSVGDELALGLDSLRLRKRELNAVQQLRTIRNQPDLKSMVTGLIEHIQQSLEADFALVQLIDPLSGEVRVHLVQGKLSTQLRSFVEGVLNGVTFSKEPVMMTDVVRPASAGGVRALLAVPLKSQDDEALGAILVGSRQAGVYTRRQLALLETLAGHLSLLTENAAAKGQLEYKAMVDERNRLAREIHDGLAQTIGFLKLQVAQLQNFLNRGDYDRLDKGLKTSYSTLAEAYADVRDAIDGLRVTPSNENVTMWMQELLTDFEEASGIQTHLDGASVLTGLGLEIQVQLIRILQEALSNVRKHAHAGNVWVTNHRTDHELIVEIRDDGRGFAPEEVRSAAQYGLRGMRERAELIGADFQVISRTGDGTLIRLSVFLPQEETA